MVSMFVEKKVEGEEQLPLHPLLADHLFQFHARRYSFVQLLQLIGQLFGTMPFFAGLRLHFTDPRHEAFHGHGWYCRYQLLLGLVVEVEALRIQLFLLNVHKSQFVNVYRFDVEVLPDGLREPVDPHQPPKRSLKLIADQADSLFLHRFLFLQLIG